MADIKKSLYIAFDKQLTEFNDQLINRFPNDNQDFKVFKTGANLLRRTSGDKIVHKIFKESIESYRHYIENKDEKFFMEFDNINVDEITPRQSLGIFYKLKSLRNPNE